MTRARRNTWLRVADFAMMRRATLAALVAVATANDPLYDYSASPLTELTDANFADTVRELRNCSTTLPRVSAIH